jgi:hypothetical protein
MHASGPACTHEHAALMARRCAGRAMGAAKANGWTPERRARQAAAIQRWKPWERSTGPKSPHGKATVARNAYKGGWRALLRELRQALREQDKSPNTRGG